MVAPWQVGLLDLLVLVSHRSANEDLGSGRVDGKGTSCGHWYLHSFVVDRCELSQIVHTRLFHHPQPIGKRARRCGALQQSHLTCPSGTHTWTKTCSLTTHRYECATFTAIVSFMTCGARY